MRKTKKQKNAAELFDKYNTYTIDEAMDLLEKLPKAKFDESLEVHIKLGVDSTQADQQVRGTVVLPNGTGKSIKVLVICRGDKEKEALEAGADYAGGEEIIAKIQNEGFLDFDKVVATPDMMGTLGRVAKILGPKGLMPNPKAGTVTQDVAKTVKELKAGKIEYRLDKTNVCHCMFGKLSFGKDKLVENYTTLLDAIVKAKPAAAKGQYLRGIYIATSMGPGIKITVA